MLDALRVGLGGFYWHSNRAKNVNNESMASADSLRQRLALLRQKYPAIWARGCQPRPLQARNGLDCRGMGDAEPARDVSRPRFAFIGQQVRNQLNIVFQ